MKLKLLEYFYSIQGEGKYTGCPSFFIRFPKCNMACGGRDGKLVSKGLATWTCDTLWRSYKTLDIDVTDLINYMKELNILNNILNGDIHIVFTGGEPLLYVKEIQAIQTALESLQENTTIGRKLLFEIETNGTLMENIPFINNDHSNFLFNVSLKLKNSGVEGKNRLREKSLLAIKKSIRLNLYDCIYKFVISNEDDIKEIYEDLVNTGFVDTNRIYLMPAMTHQKEFFEKTQFLFEMCKKYKLKGSPRMHIAVWGNKIGV